MNEPVQPPTPAPAPRRRPKRSVRAVGIPYANATSGTKAREEITKLLRRFGCEAIGFMDDFEKQEVLLAFTHRGRNHQLRASAKGWAQLWLKANPYSYRCRRSKVEYKQDALKQGQVALNSCYVTGSYDGRPLIERLAETDLLPKPTEPKVVALPGRGQP
jgi:hypothetical protein